MGRSIYCSKCKKEKEPGRDNESRCWSCKSEANKRKRTLKRQEAGLAPYGSGRSIYCYKCKKIKENPLVGYCHACKTESSKRWKLETGRIKKIRTGKCACGQEFAPYSKCYCIQCQAKQAKKWRDNNPLTEEQKARNAELQRKRFIPKIRKKERLDPVLWEKPVRNGNKVRINGVKVCARPDCNNTENLLSNNWCKTCHAEYQRERRKYYETHVSDEQKIKRRVRALTRQYIKMGKLISKPCEVCGDLKVDAHHDDYAKPLDVRWLCKKHHREHHKLFPNI